MKPALLGSRLQDLEDQLLLAHAGRARHVELLGDLGQRADAHVLERRRSMRSSFSGRRPAAPLPLARRAAAAAAGCCRGLAVVRQSVDQCPQFVQSFARDRRDRQHGMFQTRIRMLASRGAARPRDSLSILVATTAQRAGRRLQPAPRLPMSLSRPGCRASTSSRPAGRRSTPAEVRRARAPRTPRRRVAVLRPPRVAVARADPPGRTARRRRARRGRRSPAASCPARRWCAPRAGGPAR